jgi:hypothetical protein
MFGRERGYFGHRRIQGAIAIITNKAFSIGIDGKASISLFIHYIHYIRVGRVFSDVIASYSNSKLSSNSIGSNMVSHDFEMKNAIEKLHRTRARNILWEN